MIQATVDRRMRGEVGVLTASASAAGFLAVFLLGRGGAAVPLVVALAYIAALPLTWWLTPGRLVGP